MLLIAANQPRNKTMNTDLLDRIINSKMGDILGFDFDRNMNQHHGNFVWNITKNRTQQYDFDDGYWDFVAMYCGMDL